MGLWSEERLARLGVTGEVLPYELSRRRVTRRQGGVVLAVLCALSFLEIAAHLWKETAGVMACRLWAMHGCAAIAWLLWTSVAVGREDARRGQVWLLLPLLFAVPLCFFNVRGFGALNSESLSELQHALEKLNQADWGYTDVFWDVYPSRAFLPNIVPTLIAGIAPASYRLGFSIPVFMGVVIFYGGLRRYFEAHRFAAAASALAAAGMLTYPFVNGTARTFEMAISSFAFGLWAIGALLACVHRPGVMSALAAAWTAGLLAASFTSGLGLVVLIWCCTLLWLLRCLLRREWALAMVIGGILVYLTVVGTGLYAIRVNPLRPKPMGVSQMADNFVLALRMVASIDQPQVFTPALIVFPTLLVVGYALSCRAGILPLLGVLWCLAAVWASVNLHGKVSPVLPGVLYRAVVIVPVIAYCMVHLCLFAADRATGRAASCWRGMFLAAGGGLALSALVSFKTLGVFDPPRQPVQAEAVIQHIWEHLDEIGLTPFSDAILVNKTGSHALERIRPLSWYFLPGWTRALPDAPAFYDDPSEKRPGIALVLPGNPLINETFERYTVEAEMLTIPMNSAQTVEVVRLLYVPKAGEAHD